MDIFIGNISAKMTAYDLRRLFNSVIGDLSGGFLFWRKSEPTQLSFKIIEKHGEESHYRYGLATVEPDEIARECIDKVNNQFFDSQPIVVREYYQRSYMNERRAINWRDKPWHGPERRVMDRRQRFSMATAQ
jgi:RNA recognition motif-containing protein